MWGPAPLTGRRLYVLIDGLPISGAFGRSLGHQETWTTTEELLAGLIETVDQGNRLLYRFHTKRSTQQPKALKVPRPSGTSGETDGVKKKRPATSEEIRAFFGDAVRYTGPKTKTAEQGVE